MRPFIGTKLIHAEPSTGSHGDEEGYAVRYSDGYTSWSPREAFEKAYQPLDRMSFGHALELLKRGERVARAGWNGKGMWLALTPGSTVPRAIIKAGSALSHIAQELPVAEVSICPHIDMRAADGTLVVGWLASQTDMLAEDWTIVGEAA